MGLDEALNDTSPVSGMHKVFISDWNLTGSQWRRRETLNIKQPLTILHSPLELPRQQRFSGLSVVMPSSVSILTLENWSKNQILLRLENRHEWQSAILASSLKSIFQFTNLCTLQATGEQIHF